jgi:hypothetical protein
MLYYSQFNDESTMKEKERKRERERNDKLVDGSCRLLFSVINFKLNYTL